MFLICDICNKNVRRKSCYRRKKGNFHLNKSTDIIKYGTCTKLYEMNTSSSRVHICQFKCGICDLYFMIRDSQHQKRSTFYIQTKNPEGTLPIFEKASHKQHQLQQFWSFQIQFIQKKFSLVIESEIRIIIRWFIRKQTWWKRLQRLQWKKQRYCEKKLNFRHEEKKETFAEM